MQSKSRSRSVRIIRGYAIAVGAVIAATALTILVAQLFGRRPSPVFGFSFLLAIMSTAWWGGYGPGLLACVLTFFGIPALIAPGFQISRVDPTRLGLTVLVSVLVSRVAAVRKKTEQILRSANEDLERRVQERTREVEEANQELARQRLWFAETLESIGDAVIATDRDATVTFMNSVAARITGWPPAEAIGQKLDRVFRIFNEETGEPAESPTDRVLREGVIVGLANHTVLLSRSGDKFPIDDSGAPIRDGQSIRGAVLVFRDVSERRRAEKELRESERQLRAQAEQLARSNEELEQYAFAAHHDMQEPLRMVSTYTELLGRQCENTIDEEGQVYLGYIQTGVRRMHNLIADLLSYSLLAGTAEKEFVPVDSGNALAEAIGNCEAAVTASGASIQSGELPIVSGRKEDLVVVFQNLISNAVKYRDLEAPRIQVSAERRGAEWLFSVQDNGVGIDMRYSEHIFGLFKRLHGREVPGTGIGLALCKKIIEQHGGRIWVESSAGRGSIFKFTLPEAEARSPVKAASE